MKNSLDLDEKEITMEMINTHTLKYVFRGAISSFEALGYYIY